MELSLTSHPNGFRCASKIQELAQHSQILREWSLRYAQISKGRFEGNLREVWLDGVQMYEESLQQSVFQNGEARNDTLCLGVFKTLSGDTRWMGKSLSVHDITWSYGKGELMLQTPEVSSLLVLSVPVDLLDGLSDSLPRPVCSVRDEVMSGRIRQQIVSTIENMMNHPLQMAGQQARTQFQSDIRDLVFSFFNLVHAQPESLKHTIQKAQRVVVTAQDALLAHPDSPVTMEELCAMTHTSRRTLQNCFEIVTGQSPAVFLKNMRLNGVRKALVTGDADANVSQIAADWGFWHLSQFTVDYKRLFGELPSQTLKANRIFAA